MKYFLDTEFHEYKKKPLFGKAIDTIELISIGIVSEDLNEPAVGGGTLIETSYYAICKDFDVKAAWNSWQLTKKETVFDESHKEYWLRENVLKPIYLELIKVAMNDDKYVQSHQYSLATGFSLSNFSNLIKHYGKSREVIAEEIHAFIYREYLEGTGLSYPEAFGYSNPKYDPEFYAYYADYDWVVFCWLFGRMIDLPNGFPMYCKDLQQTKDEAQLRESKDRDRIVASGKTEYYTTHLKDFVRYPKQVNEHNALADAKWNKELYKFLTQL